MLKKCIIDKVCQQILTVIQNSTLRITHIKQSFDQEREEVKRLIKEQVSMNKQYNSFYIINGILIAFYQNPSYYRKMFFNQKYNDSINV